MTITIDIQEKEPILKALKDVEHRHLLHTGTAYSYDYEVETLAGQRLRIERKSLADAVSSFLTADDPCCRLCRQARSVDILLVEWSQPAADKMASRLNKPELVESCRKHLWRLSLEMPVLWTTGPIETIKCLKYLESKKEPLAIRRSHPVPPVNQSSEGPVKPSSQSGGAS